MIFNDLDKWMFEIEQKTCPTAKQRRQYVKIEHIRDKTFERYIKQFQVDKQRGRLMKNECPCPKDCSDRIFRKRKLQKECEDNRKLIGMNTKLIIIGELVNVESEGK